MFIITNQVVISVTKNSKEKCKLIMVKFTDFVDKHSLNTTECGRFHFLKIWPCAVYCQMYNLSYFYK
jgi:hypothetical protein